MDKTHGVKFLTKIRNINLRTGNCNEGSENSSQIHENIRRLTHSILQKFKTPIGHFTGKAGEDIDERFK